MSESMSQLQFTAACVKTRELVERAAGGSPENVQPVRRSETDATAWGHLAWMLHTARDFYEAGAVQKANRWLGYVQGVLAACGVSLEDLKRANMPPGESFNPEKI